MARFRSTPEPLRCARGRGVPAVAVRSVTVTKHPGAKTRGMDHLSTDTVPLTVVPGPGGAEFVIRIDEQAGVVHVDPAVS